MRPAQPRARGWTRRVWNGECELSDVPDEYYQTVRALLVELRKLRERMNRILEGR